MSIEDKTLAYSPGLSVEVGIVDWVEKKEYMGDRTSYEVFISNWGSGAGGIPFLPIKKTLPKG